MRWYIIARISIKCTYLLKICVNFYIIHLCLATIRSLAISVYPRFEAHINAVSPYSKTALTSDPLAIKSLTIYGIYTLIAPEINSSYFSAGINLISYTSKTNILISLSHKGFFSICQYVPVFPCTLPCFCTIRK